jgi:hypothetical protein
MVMCPIHSLSDFSLKISFIFIPGYLKHFIIILLSYRAYSRNKSRCYSINNITS